MQKAEDVVTLGFGLRDDADGEEVEDLVDGDAVRDQLLLDGVEPLDARLDLGLDVRFCELAFDGADDALQEGFALAAQGVDFGGELRVGEGIEACPCRGGGLEERTRRASRGRCAAAFQASGARACACCAAGRRA
jgi:hypothetical protein